MANKRVTSAPLFGSASKKEVTDIQREIRDFTSKATRDRALAEDLLRRTGVSRPPSPSPPKKAE
jgi:hypothetical protein